MDAMIEAAAPFIGVPYRGAGRSPETGWDCWGCFYYLRERLFARPVRSWAEAYAPHEVLNADRAAELIAERLSAWREVEWRPGAAVLISYFGRPAHVGLALTRWGDFIHCMGGCLTASDRRDAPRWKRRILGVYDDQ